MATRAKEHDSSVLSGVKRQNAIQKSFRFWCFFSSVIFFGLHFGVRLHWGIVFFGSRCHCKLFSDSLLVRTVARNFINSFPHRSTVAAHSARATAASLNSKPVLLGAHLAVGVFLSISSANAFVSRSEGNATQLPRGQSSEMVLPCWVELRVACYGPWGLVTGCTAHGRDRKTMRAA